MSSQTGPLASPSSTTPAESDKQPDKAGAAVPTPDAPPEADAKAKQESDERLTALQKQQRTIARARMAAAHEAQRREEAFAKREEELSRRESALKQYDEEKNDRRRNPAKWLERDFGPKWRDAVAQVAMSSQATPDMVLSEVEERVGGVQKKLLDEIQALKSELAEKDNRTALESSARARAEYEEGAVKYVESNKDKYPLVNTLGLSGRIKAVINDHFLKTCSKDEVGNIIPGEVLTAEQAADLMEKELTGLAEKASQLKQPTTAAAQDKRTDLAPRRTLSTELSGTSKSDRPPPKDDRERMERAFAAFDAVLAQRRTA